MQNFTKTIINAIQSWTKGKIKDSVADWNQNDASADNYVKNRTHYEEEVQNVILSEQTIEGFAVMQEPIYAVQNVFYIVPELNKTYTVIWDGIAYDVQLQAADSVDYLGNENYVYMQGGGNIPFALIFAGGNIFVVTESTATSHTISITTPETIVHKLDTKYLPDEIDEINEDVEILQNNINIVSANLTAEITAREEADATKMNVTNPVGAGSFSMNRKPGTQIGDYASTLGYNTTASGNRSHAAGEETIASRVAHNVIGRYNQLDSAFRYIDTYEPVTTSVSSSREKTYCGDYIHIVGNGTSNSARSNAHTLDWQGNAWYSGDVYVGSTSGTNRDEGSVKLATVKDINAPQPFFTLTDSTTNYEYIIRIQNGNITSTCKASSLAVTTLPTKTTYTVGETVDLTDMVVTLTRQDGSTEEVNNYTYTEPNMSAAGTVEITVSYVEAGETYSAVFSVTVSEATSASETTTEEAAE